MRPLWAVAIPIIGHAWAKTFGTLGVAWEALMRVVEVPDPALALIATCIMLAATNVVGIIAIAWFYGRGAGIREALPAMLVIAPLHGVGQLLVALAAPNLANVVPGALALVSIIVLARTIYARPSRVEASPVMMTADLAHAPVSGAGASKPEMALWLAFAPYILLTALIMAVELVPAVGDPLASIRFGLPFPALETGYGVATAATQAYSGFAPLTHPGTFLIVSSIIAFLVFRARGYIPAGRIDDIGVDTLKTSIPTIMALMAFIPLALVLEGSGMVLELAAGLARVASAPVYALLSPVVGAFSGFLTGSNLSANFLFGPLQGQAATALGLNPAFILAAQTAGAAVGSSVAISAILLGLGAVGVSGQTGRTLRSMLPFVIVALAAIALITLAGTWMFPTSRDLIGTGG